MFLAQRTIKYCSTGRKPPGGRKSESKPIMLWELERGLRVGRWWRDKQGTKLGGGLCILYVVASYGLGLYDLTR